MTLPKDKPPLGQIKLIPIPDEKALLDLDHRPIESYEDLFITMGNATVHINEARARYGLPLLRIELSQVRLVPADVYDGNPYLKKSDFAGVSIPSLELIVIRFDETAYKSCESTFADIDIMQTLLHELFHTGSHIKNGKDCGISGYSTKLDEGLVESQTRRIMEGEILPQIYPPAFYEKRHKMFMSRPALGRDGVAYRFEDVMYANDKNLYFYAYTPELQLVDRIRIATPLVYEQLIEYFWRSEPDLAEKAIRKAYGAECAELISSNNSLAGLIIPKMIPRWRENTTK